MTTLHHPSSGQPISAELSTHKLHLALSYDIPGVVAATPVRVWQLLNAEGKAVATLTLEGDCATDCRAVNRELAEDLIHRACNGLGRVREDQILKRALALAWERM